MIPTTQENFDPRYLRAELARLLEILAPSNILCVGRQAESLLAPMTETMPNAASLSTLAPDQIPLGLHELSTYDLAYIHGTIERLPRAVAGTLLARLRDVSARHLLVHVEIGGGWAEHASDWETSDLLAYGLTKAGAYIKGDRRAHIYQFNIFDYKLTPDWFNPQNWAHPYRWKPRKATLASIDCQRWILSSI